MLFPQGESQITFFNRPMYVVAANLPDGSTRRLFQIRLKSGADPYLSVDFAYVPYSTGLALRAISADPSQRTETFQWLDPSVAMQTSHYPKYNHHKSGKAHFSQTGKVEPVGRFACPLRQINGHAFSITLNDPSGFPRLRPKDIREQQLGKRDFVIFSAANLVPSWVTIVGGIYERDTYYGHLEKRGLRCAKQGDFTRRHYPDGRVDTVALLADPDEKLSNPESLLMELSLFPRDLGGRSKPVILFTGGFDSRNFRQIQDKPGFLAMRYPATPEPRDLSLIRSMDLVAGSGTET